MLPAPPSTAAPPRARSRASWNPAVPPPPVAGAAVGNGLADGLGVTVGVGVGVGVGDPLGDGLGLGLAELALRAARRGGRCWRGGPGG